MNLHRMPGPNDRNNVPDDSWDELCLAAKYEALDELTKEALIRRLVAAEQDYECLKYETDYWRLRYLKDCA